MKKINFKRHYLLLILLMTILSIGFQNCDKRATSFTVLPKDSGNIINGQNPVYVDKTKNFSASAASNKVDVLVVIDNSVSMMYEQQSMANRFSNFLDKLAGLEWQVGITTTDAGTGNDATEDGRLLEYQNDKYLIRSTDNYSTSESLFASTIQRSESGSSNEQGLKTSKRALERSKNSNDATNSQLIRPGAALSIIVVTDAEETGTTKASDLLNYVTTNFPGKSFKFHSIIVRKNDLACKDDATRYFLNGVTKINQNEDYGVKYQTLTESTSGILGTVCSTDYAGQLQAIGQSTANQVREVTLDCAPVDSDGNGFVDLEIRNSSNALITNYVVSGLQVRFDQPLAADNYSAQYTCVQ